MLFEKAQRNQVKFEKFCLTKKRPFEKKNLITFFSTTWISDILIEGILVFKKT